MMTSKNSHCHLGCYRTMATHLNSFGVPLDSWWSSRLLPRMRRCTPDCPLQRARKDWCRRHPPLLSGREGRSHRCPVRRTAPRLCDCRWSCAQTCRRHCCRVTPSLLLPTRSPPPSGSCLWCCCGNNNMVFCRRRFARKVPDSYSGKFLFVR